MQLSLEGDANPLGRLTYGSLVSVGLGSMEGIDLNGGTTVVGLRPTRNYCIRTLVNVYTRAIRV